ncbi:MAG: acyl carrier protein [Oscillospiraceae bacterium]|nr:acyl carrier protein [Oscillospiraceae bacterium]
MTLDALKNIIEAQLDIDPSTINENTSITEDLGADSLDMVELMMTVEEEFDITIKDSDAHLFKTVGDVVNYIDANTK